MSTGQLHRITARLRQPTERGGERRTRLNVQSVFKTPVPPFHIVYPTPSAFGKNHPIYPLHRAANRIYRSRMDDYEQMGESLSASDLVDFIREDVASNLLAVERKGFGPFSIETYSFLQGLGLHAWLPSHRERAEEMLAEFQKVYRKRKERRSAMANNDVWGHRPNPNTTLA